MWFSGIKRLSSLSRAPGCFGRQPGRGSTSTHRDHSAAPRSYVQDPRANLRTIETTEARLRSRFEVAPPGLEPGLS